MNDAQRILADMKAKLDEHFGLSPVKPEHQLSEATAAKFARLIKEEEKTLTLEERVARIEKVLGLNG